MADIDYNSLSDEQLRQMVRDAQAKKAPLLAMTDEVVGETVEGRPKMKNADGSASSERTITVQRPDGKWVNIPTIYDGKEMDEESAYGIASQNNWSDAETGRVFSPYDTVQVAVDAAKKRSESLAGPNYESMSDDELRALVRREIDGPSTMERVVSGVTDFVGDKAQAVSDMWTGDKHREFDYPELPSGIIEGSGVTSNKMALSRGDLGKVGILNQMVGKELPNRADAYGNIYVDIDEETAPKFAHESVAPGRYYLNRPGASMQDVDDIVTSGLVETATTLGPMRAGGAAAGAFGSIVGAGVGAGGGALAQDALARSQGSTAPYDLETAAWASLFGAGGEAASRTLGPLFRRMFSRAKSVKDLSKADLAALGRLGIDPDDITDDFVAKYREAIIANVDPENAIAVAEAGTLPRPVPLSRGDVSRKVADQAFENDALRGAYGQGDNSAQAVIEGFRETQNRALRENADEIAKIVGTGDDLVPGEGVRSVQETLKETADSVRAAGKKAYEEAAGAGARISAPGVRDFTSTARKALKSEFPSTSLHKPTFDLLDEMADIVPEMQGARVKSVNINRLEAWRQDLARAARGARGKPEGVSLGKLQGQFDEFMDGVVDAGLMDGNPDAVLKYKEARSIWRDLRSNYNGKEGGAKLVGDMIAAGEDGDILMEPEAALRKLFTAQEVGFKRGAVNGVKHLKKVLPEEEFKKLKQEAFLRLLKKQATGGRGVDVNDVNFSGDKFAAALEKALVESPGLMKELFSGNELRLMRQFKDVGLRATNRRGAAMDPGSGMPAIRWAQNMLQGSPLGRAFLATMDKALGWASDGTAAARAKDVTTRALPSASRPAPAIAGGAAALAGQSPEEKTERKPR